MRAPYCAAAVSQAALNTSKHGGVIPQISILEKGVHGWVNTYVNRSNYEHYIDEFDQELWMDAAPYDVSEGGLVHCMDMIWSQKGQAKLASTLEELLSNNELELEEDTESNQSSPDSDRSSPRTTSDVI